MFKLFFVTLTLVACTVKAIDLSRLYGLHEKRESNLMSKRFAIFNFTYYMLYFCKLASRLKI